MTIAEQFANAQVRVKTLTKAPGNDVLLQLYALYKQGAVGDVEGKRPGMLDIRGRAKFDAWAAVKGTPREAAMQRYIALVETLLPPS